MNGKLAARAVAGYLTQRTEAELASIEEKLWDLMSPEDQEHIEDCIEDAKKKWDTWSQSSETR